MKIITNNHKRDIVYWHELTEQEKVDFDWIASCDTLTEDDAMFFRYKGNVYCLSDIFMAGEMFPGWDGCESDSFFSGILVKYPREEWGDIDTEHVIVGWYLA